MPHKTARGRRRRQHAERTLRAESRSSRRAASRATTSPCRCSSSLSLLMRSSEISSSVSTCRISFSIYLTTLQWESVLDALIEFVDVERSSAPQKRASSQGQQPRADPPPHSLPHSPRLIVRPALTKHVKCPIPSPPPTSPAQISCPHQSIVLFNVQILCNLQVRLLFLIFLVRMNWSACQICMV